MSSTTLRGRRNKVRDSVDDRIFFAAVNIVLGLLAIVTLYPIIFVISASFSDPVMVLSGRVTFLPKGLSLEGYGKIFARPDLINGFLNSAIYTVGGTLVNIVMTIIAAYPLSRRDLKGRGGITLLFTFTMIFNGGMIPNYILMRDLNLLNTRWVMVLPVALSAYNMIIARTFFQTNIPLELLEAAKIDGCSDFKFLYMVVIPLSKAILAVLVMFYAVSHWNSYFSAFLYLNDNRLYPLQLIMRDILIGAQAAAADMNDAEDIIIKQGIAESLKYSLMVVSSIPMLILYPFAQKYFVQGVMIGSIKG
ncbi:carbohydrate ABC transporter permease [Ruminococcaceae bacterium OttesenSCG-928-L11]|nr:carbohydrate ABC transporter permease [Ruminococcaceae bacterium OttesenSCG-928-L11]